MMTLALVLLVLVALLIIAVVAGSGGSVELDVFGVEVTATVVGLFLAGLVAGVVTVLAIVLLRVGLRKGIRQRQRMRDLEQRARVAEATGGTTPTTTSAPEPEAGPDAAEPEPISNDTDSPDGVNRPENSGPPRANP